MPYCLHKLLSTSAKALRTPPSEHVLIAAMYMHCVGFWGPEYAYLFCACICAWLNKSPLQAFESLRKRIIGKLHRLIQWLWKNKGHHNSSKRFLFTNQSWCKSYNVQNSKTRWWVRLKFHCMLHTRILLPSHFQNLSYTPEFSQCPCIHG